MKRVPVSVSQSEDIYLYCNHAIRRFWEMSDDEELRRLYKDWAITLRDGALAGWLTVTLYKYRCLHIADRLTGPRRFTPTIPDEREANRILAAADRQAVSHDNIFRYRQARLYWYEVMYGYISVEHMRRNVFPAMPEDAYIGYEMWI